MSSAAAAAIENDAIENGAGREVREVRPQPGPQEDFLSSSADIAIIGGAAGGGKTWSLLLEPLRHANNRDFGAVIFRRTQPQIRNEGGLWDEARELYPALRAVSNEVRLSYTFPSGMTVAFSHLQHGKDVDRWTGAQIPLIGFDQLEEFEERQFWYLLTRNRSARAGVRPYVRATCNPVPDDHEVGGWLNRLVSWWIDPATGYPITKRSGVVRWFVRLADELHWGDSRAELRARFKEMPETDFRPKSITFIPAKLEDNPILEQADPNYRAALLAQPLVERERLLHGNWKIKTMAGKVFDRSWFGVPLRELPKVARWVRYWDKAGTQDGGKYSAGVLMGEVVAGGFLIADVVRGQWSSGNRETVIRQTAETDRARHGAVDIWCEQEPGSGGKESAENTIRGLAGFSIRAEPVTGSKLARAGPLAAQAEARNVSVMAGPWLEAFLVEAQNFDGEHGYTDQIDAASGAFNKLTGGPRAPRMTHALTGRPIG
jgi:predicted phage terminase large subunit-like protein